VTDQREHPMFWWPSAEFSVPLGDRCMHVPPEPNRDFRCMREKGHRGKHEHVWSPTIRPYSHKDRLLLHLITTSFYMAKERPRCVHCGKLAWNGASGDAYLWTSDETKYREAQDRCDLAAPHDLRRGGR